MAKAEQVVRYGITWRRYPASPRRSQRTYFAGSQCKGGPWLMLHRYTWEKERGPIPEGFHVHHIDGDAGNNSIENLECLAAAEHHREHWAQRKPLKLVCVQCQAPFESTGMRAKFCGPNCKAAHFRERHPGYHQRYAERNNARRRQAP